MNDGKLERSLRRLANASSVVSTETAEIAEHCLAKYGITAHDVDNDDFIDACCGGCGLSTGMSVAQFHASMVKAINSCDNDCGGVVRKLSPAERREVMEDIKGARS